MEGSPCPGSACKVVVMKVVVMKLMLVFPMIIPLGGRGPPAALTAEVAPTLRMIPAPRVFARLRSGGARTRPHANECQRRKEWDASP